MSELFDEVDEEVRREQLKKLWDQYSIYIIAAARSDRCRRRRLARLSISGSQKAAEAGAAFDAAIELVRSEQARGGRGGLRQARGYGAVRIPHAGAVARGRLRSQPRDPKAGAKLYDEIAADRSIGAEQQDLARIRAAGLLLDTESYPNMLQRLEAATKPDATFRHTARELLALSAWRANDTTAARQWLDMIANDGETPSAMRSRAEALQALLPPVAKS